MVEDVGGGAVAGDDGRGCIRRGAGELGAVFLCGGGVVQGRGAGNGDGLISESRRDEGKISRRKGEGRQVRSVK